MRVTKAIVDHNRKNIPKGTILVDIEKCKKAKKIVPRKQAHLEASGLDGTRYKFYPNERVFFDSRRQATAMFAAEIIKSIQLPVRIQAFVDGKQVMWKNKHDHYIFVYINLINVQLNFG